MIADILQGADTERIRSWRLDRQTTYGLLKDLRKGDIQDRIRHLLGCGCLTQSSGEYPTLALGPEARRVLFQGAQVTMRIKKRSLLPVETTETDQGLLARLRSLRLELAKTQGVPAYVIFPDKTLLEICRLQPRTESELLQVSGVGEHKLERYGAKFLEEIQLYLAENVR